jgi:hypothetical protein
MFNWCHWGYFCGKKFVLEHTTNNLALINAIAHTRKIPEDAISSSQISNV